MAGPPKDSRIILVVTVGVNGNALRSHRVTPYR